MVKDYKRAEKAEAVMNFISDRFAGMLEEEIEKGNCEGIVAYNHVIDCIRYAKLCIRCRRTGMALLVSAWIAWVINMLVLILDFI